MGERAGGRPARVSHPGRVPSFSPGAFRSTSRSPQASSWPLGSERNETATSPRTAEAYFKAKNSSGRAPKRGHPAAHLELPFSCARGALDLITAPRIAERRRRKSASKFPPHHASSSTPLALMPESHVGRLGKMSFFNFCIICCGPQCIYLGSVLVRTGGKTHCKN